MQPERDITTTAHIGTCISCGLIRPLHPRDPTTDGPRVICWSCRDRDHDEHEEGST